jgi:hypothetical protein
METKRISPEEYEDVKLMRKIRAVLFKEKNTDVKLTAGRDGRVKVIRQKNSYIT